MFTDGNNSMGEWMSFNTTILTNKIQKIKESFENGRFADSLVGALTEGQQLMVSRAFDENLDIKGQSFGEYIGAKKKQSDRSQVRGLFGATKTDKKRIRESAGLELTAYQRKRANKGRQVIKKDLQFSFGLRKSTEVVVENEKSVVLEFNNDLAANIAKGQEQQIENIRQGKPGTTKGTGATRIFTFDESEREQVTEQGKELIIQILKG